MLEVLTRRHRIRLERWLDARTPGSSAVPDFDLRLAMFGLGLGHLDELAQLQRDEVFGQETLPLPVRLGYSTGDDDSDLRLDRRRVPTESLRHSRDQAFELCRLFEDWSDTRVWTAHLEHLDRLFALLGWSTSDLEEADVLHALDRLSRGVPPRVELDLEEFTQVLTVALRDLGTDRFGGVGGGVQVLNVTEARGRTFDYLFVLGLNKGNFPRTVREDPAFPDSLRQVLGRQGHGVLPDLPLKRAGFAEERFLFAQLCAAAPNVTLSWQVADDDNRELTTSPLVERLLWNRKPTRVSAPITMQPGPDPQRQPSTAYESAIRAALGGRRQQIKAAFSRAQQADLSVSPGDLTQARLGITAELDRPSGPGSRLGPYFGFIGKAEDRGDPRRAQRLYVTTLERLAVCPWQSFLERLLRLEALPDPVEILPGLDPFLIGQLVHRVLEELISSDLPAIPANLEEARRAKTQAVQWPQGESLLRIARREAAAVANANGIPWVGFSGVLAEVALPYLDQARELLWEDPQGTQPVAVELECSLPAGKGSEDQELHFRVDRIDSTNGPLTLSDYKTNRRGVSSAKTQVTRDRHLIAEIGKGRLLQAAAYARAAGGEHDQGRYVFVNPSFKGPDEARLVSVAATDAAAIEAFEKAVDTLIEAWHAGIFFPRLVEPDVDREPSACEYCSVAEACVRGDSGMRGRLRDWSAGTQTTNPTDRIFLDAWYLASAKEPPS